MAFSVHSRTQPDVRGLDPTVYVLEYVLEESGSGRAEVWPALGFNCYRWQIQRGGQSFELLYQAPDLFQNGRPTRSGIPVLFPFPNRIRDGRFTWHGRTYQLPQDDPAKKNAIHGFACRHPWRVESIGADETCAWITGVFRCSQDGPDSRALWPADHEIQLTYRLGAGSLRIEAEVHNPDRVPLPFGLGYHPYFRMPFASSGTADDCLLTVPARSFWKLEESLPTGERLPVDASCDLNNPRRFRDLNVDTVLTDLPAASGAMPERAAIQGVPGATLHLHAGPEFRDLVVFTPPHRQAFCVEPYTCTSDAINLQARGIESGWQVLPPGASRRFYVDLRI
ncbi:MAG TPA: aldose 1-epimerase [Gemmataceae bacterium]|jgi:aldose 1-epimerase